MEEKIASFHLKVRKYDESQPNETNFNTIDNPAMNTVPFPHTEAINEAFESDLFQAEMNPGGEPIIQHLIAQTNYQSMEIAGGSYKTLMEDFLKKLEDTNNACEVTSVNFHDDNTEKVRNFISSFNSHMEVQLNQPVPTSFYGFKIHYIEVSGTHEARVVRDCMSKNSKAGININKYSDVKLPAKISFTFNNKHFDILFPWIQKPEGFFLSIKGCTADIYKMLFSKLKGLAIGLEYSEGIQSLNEFMADNYLFFNKNSGIVLKGVDLSVLLTMIGVAHVPYNLNAYAFHFLGIYNMKKDDKNDDHNHGDDSEVQQSGMILWRISVICQILFTMFVAPTPGMAILFTKKTPNNFLKWISLLITDILDGAELSVKADYVTSPRQLLTLLCYSKDKYWTSEKVLSLLPRWRSVTGGGSLTDKQCLQFLVGNTSLLTSRSLHKSLRIADPGNIGKGLGYNFNEPAVILSDFYQTLGIRFDPKCNELYNGGALVTECIKLYESDADESQFFSDVLPKLKQQMFENELTEELSPSDVFLMLCWRYIGLAVIYLKSCYETMDPIDFYRGNSFLYATAKVELQKPSKVSAWEEQQNLESVRLFSIIKNQKLLRNNGVSASVKSKALVSLKRTCRKFDIPVDQSTKFVWKKIKQHDSRQSVAASKAEDDLTMDMELDLCGFTDEGDMIIATESVVENTEATAVTEDNSNLKVDDSVVEAGGSIVGDSAVEAGGSVVGDSAVEAGDSVVGDSAVEAGGSVVDVSNEEILDFIAADPIDDPLLIYD